MAGTIQQAIFTSVRGAAMDGYQLVAASPEISDDETKELEAWGPAHDSLLDPRPRARSVNFHRLASGRYCVSLTTALDAEYSGRGGCQVYTHSLVVEPEVLRRFANNPFRIVEAALAAEQLTPHEQVPAALEPLELPGAASPVNTVLLARLARRPGPAAMARLVAETLRHKFVSVACRDPAREVLGGVINLLPVECRPEFSFTTGLRHSARRPFRLSVLSDDAEERRRTISTGAVGIDLASSKPASPATSGWAGYVESVLRDNRISHFARLLRESRPGLISAELDSLAEMCERLTGDCVGAAGNA
jgi:hypothetical protein